MASGMLICNDLCKDYGNGSTALDSVNLSTPSKGIFSLIGKNGAGKTTLARILSTLLAPTSGKASIDGLDVMDDAKELRERMAIVPQEGRAVHWMNPEQSVCSYLMWRGMGHREARSKAIDVLARLGLEEHSHKLNRRLSGGMKRKVLVAMVLASECDYIFLDEPTTGLDPISRKELWELLGSIGRKNFLFLTTHYLEEAEQMADRIGVLDRGKLLAVGTMDDLRRRVGYDYSINMRKGVRMDVPGRTVDLKDGWVKVLTTREEAFTASATLAKAGEQFYLGPISLDDIFSYLLGTSASTRGFEHGP